MLTDLDEGGREDASLSSQLPLEPSLLAGLGNVFNHIPHRHCELVTHGALEVDQHQRLYSGAVNGAEDFILCTKAGLLASQVMCPDISKLRQTSMQWRLPKDVGFERM